MNLITLKDRLMEMAFWAAVALDMVAALSLIQEVALRGRRLIQRKRS